MVMTPFVPEQKEISDTIHREYRDMIYPLVFGVDKDAISYDDLPQEVLSLVDWHMAVDCVLNVKFKGLRAAMRFTTSYRFRDAERFQHYQDATVTEFNEASDLPGELYKGNFDYFTYGYYSPPPHRLIEAIVFDFRGLKKAIVRGNIQPSSGYNPRSDQPFVGYTFDDLKRLNLVYLHLKEVDGQLTKVQNRRIA